METIRYSVLLDESYAYEATRGNIFILICTVVLYRQTQPELCISKSVANLLSSSICAATIKYHRLGHLYTTEIYYSSCGG